MKTKTIKSISKRIMAGLFSITMTVTGVVLVPKTTEAADAPATIYFATEEEYEISAYWSEDDKKVPVKPGYVFGGWYKEDKETPLKQTDLTNANVQTITAIAKFVPAEVLSIKTQAALGNKEANEKSSLRILSTVDSLNYQEVGFEYKLGGNSEAQTGKNGIAKITKVYSAIRPHKNAEDKDLIYPNETFVEGASVYFVAADVSKIKSTSEEKIVYARPFWVTMDGTEVMGLARNNRVVDKRNDNQYTSVGINLLPNLTDGEYAAVAAGKIQVKYNHTDYDVVGTPDITVDATNGGKYLFSEMECHVDDTTGTITFVGNADIQGKNMIDLIADGLFANVRFEQTTTTENATLDFTIDATDFCNWEENLVKEIVVQ